MNIQRNKKVETKSGESFKKKGLVNMQLIIGDLVSFREFSFNLATQGRLIFWGKTRLMMQ